MAEAGARAALIERFLAAHGWAGGRRTPLAGDASFRRYQRLRRGLRRAVLMDAPPGHEDVRPYCRIARHLTGLGYSAPAIYAEDADAGLLLIEDLGDDTYSRLLAAGANGDAERLYGAAIDLLADLHRHPAPGNLASYDDDAYLAEADLMLDWFMPAIPGAPAAEPLRRSYHQVWQEALPLAALGPPVLVLRDYHADNLIWLPGRKGVARVGLLDFQDARAGSPAYDVVSLLEDCRRDVPPDLAEQMIGRYLDAMAEIDRAAFRAAYAVLGAQRNAKIVGIFTRLWRRDGKPAYLGLIPGVWRLLEGDLAHPALEAVRAWFDRHLPPPLRRAPVP
ncbi:MAG TPA: phosphotransferase [Alphaproteobacteria bacterium]